MDKKIAGLLGAAAAFTTVTAAHAAVPGQQTELTPPSSYGELLQPVPNAVAMLKADDLRQGAAPVIEDGVQTASTITTTIITIIITWFRVRCVGFCIRGITITTTIITITESVAVTSKRRA